jgi:hypothetical protein
LKMVNGYNNELSVEPDHNLYILGAGFSKNAGLPLIADFLNVMRDCCEWLHAKEGRELAIEAINEVFKFRLKAASAAYRIDIDVENIEALFSLASAANDERLMNHISIAVAATIDYARQIKEQAGEPGVLSSVLEGSSFTPPEEWNEAPSRDEPKVYRMPTYQAYAGIISGRFCQPDSERTRNTVITFNYDTVLEEALEQIGVNPNYGLPNANLSMEPTKKISDSLLILKLHGSVNWLWSEDRSIRIRHKYEDTLDAKDQVVLIPPTWHKVFQGALTQIWGKALDAIKAATRIIVVGFSMPKTDIHFKYLMAEGLRENISLREIHFVTVTDGVDSLKENITGIFRQQLMDQKIIQIHDCGTHRYLMDKRGLFNRNKERDVNFVASR